MDRTIEREELVDLGQASLETKGIGLNYFDGTGNARPVEGLEDLD